MCRVRASTCAVRAFACACAASCPSFPCEKKNHGATCPNDVVPPMCPMMTDDDQRAYDFSTRSSDALQSVLSSDDARRAICFGVACDRAVGCHWAWIHVIGRAWRAWGCRFVFHDDDDDDGDDRARAVRACVRARARIYIHT